MKLVSIVITLLFYPAFLSGAAAKVMVRPQMTTSRIEQARAEAQKFRELDSRFAAASLVCQAETAAKVQAALGVANLTQVQSKTAQQTQSSVVAKELEARREKESARKKAEEEQKKLQEEARIKKQQAEHAQEIQELRTLDLELGRKLRRAWREIHKSADPFLAEFRQVERDKQWGEFSLEAWEECEGSVVTCIQECENALSEAVSTSEKLYQRVQALQNTEESMNALGSKWSLLRAKVDAFYAFSYCGYYREKILSLQHNFRCILGKVGAIKKSLACDRPIGKVPREPLDPQKVS